VSLFAEKAGRWQLVTSSLTFDAIQKLPESPAPNIDIDDLRIARASGLAVFVVRNGTNATVRLYDATHDKTIEAVTLDDSKRDLRVWLRLISPSDVILYVERVLASNPANRTRVGEFLYRDGNLTVLPHHEGYISRVLPDGTQIRHFGFTVAIYPPNGTARTTRF
jgi:hypothetical protein